ncbi:hypothetical protein F5051DRAFT_433622 [Lentinula edodes]|nr:hypothetical protein F5051DRAFT_433622 [Lentinula edodes]
MYTLSLGLLVITFGSRRFQNTNGYDGGFKLRECGERGLLAPEDDDQAHYNYTQKLDDYQSLRVLGNHSDTQFKPKKAKMQSDGSQPSFFNFKLEYSVRTSCSRIATPAYGSIFFISM